MTEKRNGGQSLPLKQIGLSGAVSAALLLVLTLLYAALCGSMEQSMTGTAVHMRLILLAVSVCGGSLACRRQTGEKAPCALLCGGLLFLFVLALTLFLPGSSTVHISLLYNFLIIISGVFLGCLLASGGRKRRRRR